MTVTELEGTMPNAEFVRWTAYFGRIAQRRQLDEKLARATGGR